MTETKESNVEFLIAHLQLPCCSFLFVHPLLDQDFFLSESEDPGASRRTSDGSFREDASNLYRKRNAVPGSDGFASVTAVYWHA